MSKKKEPKIEEGSDNVFKDLDYPNPEGMAEKVELIKDINKSIDIIKKSKLEPKSISLPGNTLFGIYCLVKNTEKLLTCVKENEA